MTERTTSETPPQPFTEVGDLDFRLGAIGQHAEAIEPTLLLGFANDQGQLGISALALQRALVGANKNTVLWLPPTVMPPISEEEVTSHLDGRLIIDRNNREAVVDGDTRMMPRRVFGVLDALSRNPERVMTRSALYEEVWGDPLRGESRTVDVHVLRLRRALAPLSWMIKTRRDVGYVFTEEEPKN